MDKAVRALKESCCFKMKAHIGAEGQEKQLPSNFHYDNSSGGVEEERKLEKLELVQANPLIFVIDHIYITLYSVCTYKYCTEHIRVMYI